MNVQEKEYIEQNDAVYVYNIPLCAVLRAKLSSILYASTLANNPFEDSYRITNDVDWCEKNVYGILNPCTII